jgi:two-component system, NtrC family, response regulator AtoC
MPGGRVLLVDDEMGQTDLLRSYLKDLPLEVQAAEGPAAACQWLRREPFHAVLCDLLMPGGGGLEVLRFVRSQGLPTPVIIITGYGDEETVEECVTAGAFDFIAKPIDRLSLVAVLRRALLWSDLIFEEQLTPPSPPPFLQFPNLVGTSAALQEVLWRIAKVAAADTNVCLYGESGTGKELVARAIHYAGPRASHPLVVLDCAAIPEGLMESEMFGHVKGAFTSAVTDREGVFQLAEGGTLFLDEVGELPLPLQAKLLRVIQCREFRRVGGKHPCKVNVRLIAATNKDLRARVAAGQFREDLFYRLEVIPITLPPLRERKEDIPLLVDHCIAKFNRHSKKQIRGLSARTLGGLLRYPWPGNIRELENCIERAAVMTDGDVLDVPDLTQLLRPPPAGALPEAAPAPPQSLKEAERALILQTLQSVQGNRTRAAELLGISLRGLYYKLKELQQAGVLPASGNGNGTRESHHEAEV